MDKKKNEIIQKLKKDTLKKFEDMIKQRPQEDVQSGSYLYSLVNNIIHNAEVKISNVELIYMHHVNYPLYYSNEMYIE